MEGRRNMRRNWGRGALREQRQLEWIWLACVQVNHFISPPTLHKSPPSTPITNWVRDCIQYEGHNKSDESHMEGMFLLIRQVGENVYIFFFNKFQMTPIQFNCLRNMIIKMIWNKCERNTVQPFACRSRGTAQTLSGELVPLLRLEIVPFKCKSD